MIRSTITTPDIILTSLQPGINARDKYNIKKTNCTCLGKKNKIIKFQL